MAGRVLLIHGFEGSNKKGWLSWLSDELRTMGYTVMDDDLPDPDHPNFERDMAFLKNQIRYFDAGDTVLGFSLGGFYASKLVEEKPLGRLILVAPAIAAIDTEYLRSIWPESDVDALENVFAHDVDIDNLQVDEQIVLLSKDDPFVPFKIKVLFNDYWDIIVYENMGHFSMKQFPDLLGYF
ncbi:hypothetical protein GF340_02195 [Candidatus Peregrinibacteria bacterium]|nr:hypothetical protein [Candidatus Peregrinibacteria bacterium]